GKLFANEGFELAGYVVEFLFQRINSRDLVVAWAAFIAYNGSVERRRFFADALLTGDGAAFRRGHDLLAHGFHFAAEPPQLCAEDIVALQSCGPLHERVMRTIDAVDVETHLPQH